MATMTRHYVTFYSPGTFVAEETTKEIESWDVPCATEMSRTIKERYGATPYGFRFHTRERSDEDFNSRETVRGPMYYLGGTIKTRGDIVAEQGEDSTLARNMKWNNWDKVVENNNSWKWTQPLGDDDIVLEFEP